MSWKERFAWNEVAGVLEHYIAHTPLTHKLLGYWHSLIQVY